MRRVGIQFLPLLAAALACMHGARHDAGDQRSTMSGTGDAHAGAGGMGGMCPMDVPGTKLSTSETPTGETVTFSTSPDQVQALRQKVRAMADMHNQHQGAHGQGGHEMHGMHGDMSGGGHADMPPPSHVVVEDTPDGARLVATPEDPADLQRLQTAVRSHAEMMQQGGCGMMHHDPQG